MAGQKSILEDKTITQAKHQYSSTVVLAWLHWAVYNFFEGNFCECPLFGIKTRPQHQELHSLLFTRSTLVLKLSLQTSTEEMQETGKGCRIFAALEKSILTNFLQRQGIGDKLIYINPLSHMSDQDRIYPHNINSISTR